MLKVDHREYQGYRGGDTLHGLTLLLGERRAKRLVAPQHLA